MNETTKAVWIDSHEYRGLTYLPSGQRMEGWIPEGLWNFTRTVQVSGGWSNPEPVQGAEIEIQTKAGPVRWIIGIRQARDAGFTLE